MNTNTAVLTTFPNNMFDVYARQMIQSFVTYWPKEIPLLIELDNDLLAHQISGMLRPQDAIAAGWEPDHQAFVERHKGKDDPSNYRKQPVRFCHKVFALKRALDAAMQQRADDPATAPRYLIWLDADVITTKPVSLDDIKACLPKEGDAVAYLGRKDWDHSECGWLAFDLENGGDLLINSIVYRYTSDMVINFPQQHDSWVFDVTMQSADAPKSTNLTTTATGMDVWPQSPMDKWSTHHKGPVAKSELAMKMQPQSQRQNTSSNVIIQTKNAIPAEEIRAHIEKNQKLIKNWVRPCKKSDEQVIIVSAGPLLIAEDVRKEAGKKIVAVKHALTPLKKAGITPWACILLDPRPHVADFIQEADPAVIWFVASQVNPEVTLQLLAKGCTVWGYHAAVNAGEEELIRKQEGAIIAGGSATATRGMYLLQQLGFNNMKLYGYDLSMPDKPDLNAKDEQGQPKYFEMSVGMSDPLHNVKRMFWSEPQLIAQFEELNDIIKTGKFELEAEGWGIVPFMIKSKKVADLRRSELRARIAGDNPPTYKELLEG